VVTLLFLKQSLNFFYQELQSDCVVLHCVLSISVIFCCVTLCAQHLRHILLCCIVCSASPSHSVALCAQHLPHILLHCVLSTSLKFCCTVCSAPTSYSVALCAQHLPHILLHSVLSTSLTLSQFQYFWLLVYLTRNLFLCHLLNAQLFLRHHTVPNREHSIKFNLAIGCESLRNVHLFFVFSC
jgi:hypothetical protein